MYPPNDQYFFPSVEYGLSCVPLLKNCEILIEILNKNFGLLDQWRLFVTRM